MDSIFLNGFSLEILMDNSPIEKIIYRNSSYYSLPNKSEYVIKLGNDHGVKTDAHVWIGNSKIGVWRINPYSKITIEKSANSGKKFILLKEDTIYAQEAIVNGRDSANGLIKIIFKPEKISEYIPKDNPIDSYYQNQSYDPSETQYLCKSYTDTVTPADKIHRFCAMDDDSYSRYIASTLSPIKKISQNNQQYKTVGPLENIDDGNITTIYARLVVDDDRSTARRKYMALRDSGKINNSTTIPPPLELRHPARPHTCDVDSKFTLSKKYWFDSF